MRAKIKVDPERQIGPISPLIYGQFLSRRWGVAERGLHDPEHPKARPDGIRVDVLEKIIEARPTVIRWPGGCTGTTYHWQDGIGKSRPRKLDLHFGFPATYDFGTDEFVAFCREVGAEPLIVWAMAVSTIDEGMAWLEYCNGSADTYYANLRRANGHEEPYRVKFWQIGNEMYGRHEIGHMSSAEYAAVAREWAKTAKRVDPAIKIIAVGGTTRDINWYFDPLREAGEFVDYISMHTYWGLNGQDAGYEAIVFGPNFTEEVVADVARVINIVRREKRLRHNIGLAFTEWNAWRPHTHGMREAGEPYQPDYRLTEALAVAAFINVMHRQCRTITLATVAQTLNVVGLLTVNAEGVVVEPVYWPLWMARRVAGEISLDVWLECEGTVAREVGSGAEKDVPYLDVAATLDPEGGRIVISAVNRHPSEEAETELVLSDTELAPRARAYILYHDDAQAMNTLAEPENVSPRVEEVTVAGPRFSYAFLPHSYTLLELFLSKG